MKEYMAQADPQNFVTASERTNGQLQILSSNKITYSSKIWTNKRGALKKIYFSYKVLMI